MQLFYTDEQFKNSGAPLPGIPFLANAKAELVESANRYLFEVFLEAEPILREMVSLKCGAATTGDILPEPKGGTSWTT